MNQLLLDLENWIEDVNDSEKLILVEGKSDKKALRNLGVSNMIVCCNKQPKYQIIEFIIKTKKEVIILTDLDKEGKKLYGRFNSDFQHFGVKVDRKFREFLQKNTTLDQIEGISTYYDHLERKSSLG